MMHDDGDTFDVAIFGAGPAGLAAGCECQRRGLRFLILDRGGLAQSFTEYPQALRFFSPPREMEIDGVPLTVAADEKPTRETYLAYLRGVARTRVLPLATWESIQSFHREDDGRARIETAQEPGTRPGRLVRARAVVLAVGTWSQPVTLPCPGSDAPHVHSEFHEPTAYYGKPVLVVGGGNSALGAALSLAEAGANVTLSMRRPPKDYRCGVRPHVRRNLGFAVDEGLIRLHADTVVREIAPESALLQPVLYTGEEDLAEGAPEDYRETGPPFRVPTRFVFTLLGHRPDIRTLRETFGLALRRDGRPMCDPETWETERQNVFLAGSVADPSIDIVLKLREQARGVVQTIAARLNEASEPGRG